MLFFLEWSMDPTRFDISSSIRSSNTNCPVVVAVPNNNNTHTPSSSIKNHRIEPVSTIGVAGWRAGWLLACYLEQTTFAFPFFFFFSTRFQCIGVHGLVLDTTYDRYSTVPVDTITLPAVYYSSPLCRCRWYESVSFLVVELEGGRTNDGWCNDCLIVLLVLIVAIVVVVVVVVVGIRWG